MPKKDQTISDIVDGVKQKNSMRSDIDNQIDDLKKQKGEVELEKRKDVESIADLLVADLVEEDLTLLLADTLNKAKTQGKCDFLSITNSREVAE